MENLVEVRNSEIAISGVQSVNIPLLWERVAPLLERVLPYTEGEYTLQDIYSLLMYQKMQLWIVATEMELKACCVTEFRTFPQKKVCYIVFIAGDEMTEWEHYIDVIEQWAYEEGAHLLQTYGRPGWKKVAKRHGYHVRYQLYCKELCSPEGPAH